MRLCSAGTVLVAVALIAVGCTQGPQQEAEPGAEMTTPADDPADIRALSSLRDAALSSSDAAGLAALYADGAIMMPPSNPVLTGREAIQARCEALFADFSVAHMLVLEEIEFAGDWAFARGPYSAKYVAKSGGKPIETKGKYIVIYSRQGDGTWKIARDIWNTDSPPPGYGG